MWKLWLQNWCITISSDVLLSKNIIYRYKQHDPPVLHWQKHLKHIRVFVVPQIYCHLFRTLNVGSSTDTQLQLWTNREYVRRNNLNFHEILPNSDFGNLKFGISYVCESCSEKRNAWFYKLSVLRRDFERRFPQNQSFRGIYHFEKLFFHEADSCAAMSSVTHLTPWSGWGSSPQRACLDWPSGCRARKQQRGGACSRLFPQTTVFDASLIQHLGIKLHVLWLKINSINRKVEEPKRRYIEEVNLHNLEGCKGAYTF